MESVICSVGPENFEKEVTSEGKPILLLCMSRNEEFSKALRIIERIAKKYGSALKVCLLEEEFIAPFKERYHVIGTPTFLIMVAGKERKRLLGLVDEKTLISFIEHP